MNNEKRDIERHFTSVIISINKQYQELEEIGKATNGEICNLSNEKQVLEHRFNSEMF